MIASAHVAAGFAAGMASARISEKRIARIAMAFTLGVLSHVVLDAVPHSDYASLSPSTVRWITVCEIAGVCALAGYIVRDRLRLGWREYILAGLAGSVIPDAKFLARMVLPRGSALLVERAGDSFHALFHADRMSVPLLGLGLEIACTLLLLATLIVFPRTTVRVR